jgi:hypothetical protein
MPPSLAPVVAPAAPPPPVDEVAVSDEIAVHFFSAPPVTHSVPHLEEPSPSDPATERRRRSSSETAVARRRNLARYVMAAVAVCFMICVAAAVRAATVSRGDAPAPRAAYQAGAEPKEGDRRAVPEPARAPAEELPSAPAAPAVEALPSSTGEAAVETATAAAGQTSEPASNPVDARAAKRVAQQTLERGDAAASIAAARQSLEADPTDAETWLILGGAYQQRGDYRAAREAFAGCASKATRGPRGECRALLR